MVRFNYTRLKTRSGTNWRVFFIFNSPVIMVCIADSCTINCTRWYCKYCTDILLCLLFPLHCWLYCCCGITTSCDFLCLMNTIHCILDYFLLLFDYACQVGRWGSKFYLNVGSLRDMVEFSNTVIDVTTHHVQLQLVAVLTKVIHGLVAF